MGNFKIKFGVFLVFWCSSRLVWHIFMKVTQFDHGNVTVTQQQGHIFSPFAFTIWARITPAHNGFILVLKQTNQSPEKHSSCGWKVIHQLSWLRTKTVL